MSSAALLSTLASVGTPQYGPLGGAVEAMWELPASGAPKAILFLAHGCSHSATDFWFPSSVCTTCLGLPEEVRIVKAALAAQYAVLAVSSSDRELSRCWSFEVDGPLVRDAIAALRSKAGLPAALPVVALGASSGGAFVLQLPALVKEVKAVVSQIMAIPPSMLPERMPPTLFVHMGRDARTAAAVHRCVKKLKSSGVAAHQIEVGPTKPTADASICSSRRTETSATQP